MNEPHEPRQPGKAIAARVDAQSATLRRPLGSPALFGIVQGFIAASIYFATGLVAESAQGWTWVVFAAASLFFVLGVVSYVEGASLHQERGGATVIARYGFNELVSFVAGWAVLLDYLILTALTALAATLYLAELWSPLERPGIEFGLAAVIVCAVAYMNLRGATPKRFERAALLVVVDLALQVTVIVLGIALVLEPSVLTNPGESGGAVQAGDIVFAFTLAAAAAAGIDASSGLAGQVAIGRKGLRRLVGARSVAAVVPYVGLALLASSVLPAGGVSEGEIDAPLLGIADAFEPAWLAGVLRFAVALSAVVVLVCACNAAMLGLSRLGYSLATNRQIPSKIGRLHVRHATPVVIIGIGTAVALGLLVPLDLEFLGGIYAFGAMLAFTIVHCSVIALRFKERGRDRPYRVPLNVPVRGTDVPLPAVVGAVVSAGAFVSVVLLHEGARITGFLWMAGGLILYVAYRLSEDKPILKRVTIPSEALTREAPDAQYGRILVPVFGTPLDVEIVQTAGRLAREDVRGEEGCQLEAMWIREVPLTLPVDAPWPKQELARAEEALARAKAVGEEYDGVKVKTVRVAARKAGEAIVSEARKEGVQAIVLAAEAPSRTRGGVLFGGRGEGRDFLGAATRYVVEKAPCRVIFTAPPATDPVLEPEADAAAK